MIVTVLIGPSGVGKSTLLTELTKRCPVTIVRTVTTRPRRAGEDDVTHEFVDTDTFAALRGQGRFLGTHRHYGHDYGLPVIAAVEPSGGAVVACLRAAVVERLRSHHDELDVIALEAPIPVLLDRLAARGDLGDRGDLDRADPAALRSEVLAGRGLADLVLDTTAPVHQLAERLALRLSSGSDRTRLGT